MLYPSTLRFDHQDHEMMRRNQRTSSVPLILTFLITLQNKLNLSLPTRQRIIFNLLVQ